MAGASFSMDFSRMRRIFGNAVEQMAARQELANTIGEQLVSSTLERFEDGKGPDGKEWDKSQRAKDENGRTLVDRGHLKASINYEASPAAVIVGTTDRVKGAIHQLGGTIKPKRAKALKFKIGPDFVTAKKVKMPARPYLGINEADIEDAKDTIAEFMQRGFGG